MIIGLLASTMLLISHYNTSGSDLYGGLLDGCTVNPFAEVYLGYNSSLKRNRTGLEYFKEIAVAWDDAIVID